MTVAEYLLARLAELGIRHLFGVPGDFNLWFLEQVIHSREISFVGCCNELNASYAADGYARLAGIGALATTYGVGELGAIAGVAGAYAEKVPVICITGAPPLTAILRGALVHHTLGDGNYNNMMDCYRNFTVAQSRLEPNTAREEIDRVLKSCWTHKRPVYLQLPSDVAGFECGPAPRPFNFAWTEEDAANIELAVELLTSRLQESQAPALLIDADVDRFELLQPVLTLARSQGLPIAHVVPARGVVSDDDPNAIGIYRGAGSAPEVRRVVEDSDCLICVGLRLTDVATGLFTHHLDSKSMIDVQPFEVKIDRQNFQGVPAAKLLQGVASRCRHAHRAQTVTRPKTGSSTAASPDDSLDQSEFWRQIQSFLREDDVVISDTGTAFFASAGLHLPKGARYLGQPIWGALGFGLPAALGSCCARKDRRQLVFVGDGALQMSVQELSTLIWLDLKPVIFLLNNDGYTIERLIYGEHSRYNDVNPWKYNRLPDVFGGEDTCVVRTVRSGRELRQTLMEARDPERLHFIEVVLPRMDALDPLIGFARRAAEFDFPQIRDAALSKPEPK